MGGGGGGGTEPGGGPYISSDMGLPGHMFTREMGPGGGGGDFTIT